MKTKTIVFLLISIVISFGICILTEFLVEKIFTKINETLIPFIPFCGVILVAAINSYFTRTHQIETEERTRKTQMEAENRREKQKNYDELVSLIAEYVRNEGANNDKFATIHLKSWIYGNEEVISKTKEFIELRRAKSFDQIKLKLQELLFAIREDIGLSKLVSQNQTLIADLLPESKEGHMK